MARRGQTQFQRAYANMSRIAEDAEQQAARFQAEQFRAVHANLRADLAVQSNLRDALRLQRDLRQDAIKEQAERTQLEKTIAAQTAIQTAISALSSLDPRSPDFEDAVIKISAENPAAFQGKTDLIRPVIKFLEYQQDLAKQTRNDAKEYAERHGRTLADVIETDPKTGQRRYNLNLIERASPPVGFEPIRATVGPDGKVSTTYEPPKVKESEESLPAFKNHAEVRADIKNRFGYDIPTDVLFGNIEGSRNFKYTNSKGEEKGDRTHMVITYNVPGKGESKSIMPIQDFTRIRRLYSTPTPTPTPTPQRSPLSSYF